MQQTKATMLVLKASTRQLYVNGIISQPHITDKIKVGIAIRASMKTSSANSLENKTDIL
jgi:hypothetical protein